MQPVYICLDTSGSMRGEPIAAVNVGLSSLLSALRARPGLAERVQIAVHTFDAVTREVVPLQSAATLTLPRLEVPGSGPTLIGEALEAIIEAHHGYPKTAETLPAMLFVMTDGSPTDLQIYEEAIPKIKALGLKRIVAFAAGPKAKVEPLEPLADEVITLDTLDAQAFARMFDHVATLIDAGAAAAPGANADFSAPPDVIRVEF